MKFLCSTSISIKHRSHEPKLISRLIWQELFTFYQQSGGNLREMDNMLVDYDIIKTKVEPAIYERKNVEFFWSVNLRSGMTDIINCAEETSYLARVNYLVEDDIVKVTFYQGEYAEPILQNQT